MKKKLRIASITFALCGVTGLGIVGAQASAGYWEVVPSAGPSDPDWLDHPECYDSRRMNDPADYCYQNIGPWNSTSATVADVRAHVSLQSMIDHGTPLKDIRKYYPEYSPSTH